MAIKIVPLLLAAVLAFGASSASEPELDSSRHSRSKKSKPDDDTKHSRSHKSQYKPGIYPKDPPKAHDFKSIFSLIVNGKCGTIPGTTTTADMVVPDDTRYLTVSENDIDPQFRAVVGSFGEFIDECQYHDGVAIEGFEILSETAEANATAPSSVWYCCPGKLIADNDKIALGCSYSLVGDTRSDDGFCGTTFSSGLSVVTQYGKMQTICCGSRENFLGTGYL